MKTENLIKALKKLGLTVEKSQRQVYDHSTGEYGLSTPEYFARNEKNKISFYDQDGEIVCCQVMGIRQNNDSQTDYFPGFFARTIKSAISGMGY